VSTAELRTIERRFVLLLALRFVPTGLMVAVFVLLLSDRGLTIAEIGLGTAAQGIVMLFLELPSGGLADALGRKPVLVLASLFSMAAIAVLLVADSLVLLAVVSGLQGVFRALDSGPLEAWFIDASLVADQDVDIERGLARQNVVICSSIGLGALLGGGIAASDSFLGIDSLTAPLVLAGRASAGPGRGRHVDARSTSRSSVGRRARGGGRRAHGRARGRVDHPRLVAADRARGRRAAVGVRDDLVRVLHAVAAC
jgi:MFS family permease